MGHKWPQCPHEYDVLGHKTIEPFSNNYVPSVFISDTLWVNVKKCRSVAAVTFRPNYIMSNRVVVLIKCSECLRIMLDISTVESPE